MEMIEYRDNDMKIGRTDVATEERILKYSWLRDHWNDEEFRAYLLEESATSSALC